MNYYKEQKRSSTLVRSITLAAVLTLTCTTYADEGSASKHAAKTEGVKKLNNAQKGGNGEGETTADDEADYPDAVSEIKDPYEKFNRVMFNFNDFIDTYALKPIAKAYNVVMPRPINQGVHNFFNNLSNIPTIANDLFQLNMYQASHDTWRFVVNTTVGVGGLFDVATRINLPQYSNDFGMTLAYWGYKNSNYLVLPFFGPSTIRDGMGLPVDYFAFSVYPYVEPNARRYQLYVLGVVDRRAQLLKFESVMDEAALDKYTFLRDAYMQRRAYQIEKNQHVGIADRDATIGGEASSSVVSSAAGKTPAPQPVPRDLTPEAIS